MNNPLVVYQEPTPFRPVWWNRQRRSDLAVALVIIAALLMAGLFKTWVQEATRRIEPGSNLPTVHYPLLWRQSGNLSSFQAYDPSSSTAYPTRIEVAGRQVTQPAGVERLSEGWLQERQQQLSVFHHLVTMPATGPQGQAAQFIKYAFVVDPPTDDAISNLPTVIQAADLIYMTDAGDDQRLVVLTVSSVADTWHTETITFEKLFDRMGITGITW